MPRVNIGTGSTARTPGTKALEDKIIDRFGMSLNMEMLLKVLGLRDRGQARQWLASEGLQAIEVNGRKRWLATDVARALENSKFRT